VEEGDETSPPREGGSDRGWHDKTEPERMAANKAMSGTSDFAPSPGALCGVSLIREIREIRGPLVAGSRVGHPSWAVRAAPQPSGFAAGSAGPQSTQKDAELGCASTRTDSVRPREAPSVRFVSSPWNRGDSRLAEALGCHHPQPPPQAEGVGILVTGDRGWRPDGLTPGYCLKPFQGFGDGLGKARGSAELMTSCEVFEGLDGGWDISSQRVLVSKAWEAWRRDVSTAEVIEGLDWGWDVSSQTVLVSKAWECGDETSPPPKSLTVWMGAGTSRPRKFWVRGGQLATRGRHPAGG